MAKPALHSDFSEFLRLLNTHDVRYLVVGGHAVAYHGYPRTTKDIDFLVSADARNIPPLEAALSEFGFPGADFKRWSKSPEGMIRMGEPPVRIAIFHQIPGINFDDAYERGIVDSLGGVPIRMISLDDLRMNKRATGRARDLADLEELPEPS